MSGRAGCWPDRGNHRQLWPDAAQRVEQLVAAAVGDREVDHGGLEFSRSFGQDAQCSLAADRALYLEARTFEERAAELDEGVLVIDEEHVARCNEAALGPGRRRRGRVARSDGQENAHARSRAGLARDQETPR